MRNSSTVTATSPRNHNVVASLNRPTLSANVSPSSCAASISCSDRATPARRSPRIMSSSARSARTRSVVAETPAMARRSRTTSNAETVIGDSPPRTIRDNRALRCSESSTTSAAPGSIEIVGQLGHAPEQLVRLFEGQRVDRHDRSSSCKAIAVSASMTETRHACGCKFVLVPGTRRCSARRASVRACGCAGGRGRCSTCARREALADEVVAELQPRCTATSSTKPSMLAMSCRRDQASVSSPTMAFHHVESKSPPETDAAVEETQRRMSGNQSTRRTTISRMLVGSIVTHPQGPRAPRLDGTAAQDLRQVKGIAAGALERARSAAALDGAVPKRRGRGSRSVTPLPYDRTRDAQHLGRPARPRPRRACRGRSAPPRATIHWRPSRSSFPPTPVA